MKVEVKRTKQFPNGVVDLRGLSGGETIMMDAGLGQMIWLKGQATGPQRLFGSMRIGMDQGPYGFGFRVGHSVGDAPLTVQTLDFWDPEANDASIYELTEEGLLNIWKRLKGRIGRRKGPWTGPREWVPE